MKIDFNSESPIYIQVSQAIEDGILNGSYIEEKIIPSTTEIAINFKINPATVAKGFNLLVENGLIYKKRGVGMFVEKGSKERLIENRKERFYKNYILTLIEEGKKLRISKNEIINMIEKGD